MRTARPVAARTLVALLLAATCAWRPMAGQAPPGPQALPEPYRKSGEAPLQFPGPGRDDPDPAVDEVVIGWFGPPDPAHPEFGAMWRGAAVALDEENATGYQPAPAGGRQRDAAAQAGATATTARSIPFRLAAAWSESPWQGGISDLLALVYATPVWAVIGGVDGTSTHLAMQAALKSRFLLLSPGSTDATADHGNVPWLFSLPPADDEIAPVMVDALERTRGTFAIVTATDHSSHATLVALRRVLDQRHLVPAASIDLHTAEQPHRGDVAAHVTRSGAGTVFVLAPALESAMVVGALRRGGFGGAIVGGPRVATSAFRDAAGAAAEGVMAPAGPTGGARWVSFASAYSRRWGRVPDADAANGYDAVRAVASAIRRAGLNRARIRDAVRALAPWDGAAGAVRWDALGRNQGRRIALARWAGGFLSEVAPPH